MISNIKIFLLCPIPEDQKPINEYIEIKENPLFRWTTLKNKEYYSKLFWIYSICFLFISFFEINVIDQNFYEKILLTLSISLGFFLLFLLIMYFRWKDIQLHFNKSRVFYEEASWFDGQIWEKPFFLIKNDKLISTQKIQPILQRLLITLWLVVFLEGSIFTLFEFGLKNNYN
jgi:hypothetical protein